VKSLNTTHLLLTRIRDTILINTIQLTKSCYLVSLFIYLFIYLRTQHSKQYKIEDTIKAAKF